MFILIVVAFCTTSFALTLVASFFLFLPFAFVCVSSWIFADGCACPMNDASAFGLLASLLVRVAAHRPWCQFLYYFHQH